MKSFIFSLCVVLSQAGVVSAVYADDVNLPKFSEVVTGQSIYEAQDLYGLDSRGRGFWALGAGTLLTKNIYRWDGFLSFEAHRSLARRISTSQLNGTLTPGWGGNLSIGAGYNTNSFRCGGSLTWTYEDPIAVAADQVSSSGVAQRYATGSLTGSYMIADSWSATLTYSDQTLFGDPLNTTLGRAVSFQLLRRFER